MTMGEIVQGMLGLGDQKFQLTEKQTARWKKEKKVRCDKTEGVLHCNKITPGSRQAYRESGPLTTYCLVEAAS